MRFIKLLPLLLLCFSCSTAKHIAYKEAETDKKYDGLTGSTLTPLAIVNENSDLTLLKADKIRIVHNGGEPDSMGVDWVPARYAFQKIWGKYQWMGIVNQFDGSALEAQVLEINPDLTYTIYNYRKLKQIDKKHYEARRRTKNEGKIVWVKGNLYLLNVQRNGQVTNHYFTVRINATGAKFLVVSQDLKTRERRFGRRLRKTRE